MSTKTTFKRLALVTVAALGLGVLSVAPSSAVINSDVLTVSAATGTQTTGETATATSVTATLAFLAGAANDSMSVTASLVSGPATSVALPFVQLVETSSSLVDVGNINGTYTRGTSASAFATWPNQKTIVTNSVSGAAQVTAKFKVYLGLDTITAPAVDGTYVVKLTPALYSGTTGGGNATAQTITITVSKSVANIATAGTVILNRGETDGALVDDVVTASKSILNAAGTGSALAAATIKVSLLNAAGTAAVESYTAVITGPGTLAPVSTVTSTGTSLGRAITVKHSDRLHILPDGSAGVATVTISTAAGVVIGTKSITFYGAAATITAKTAALLTGTVAKVGTTDDLISFKVVDAAGVEVTTGSYYLVTNDATKISNSYTACNAWDATDGFTCDVTGVAKGTATVYVTNKPSATDTTVTTVLKSGDVSVRVGSTTVASVSVTTDKANYAPGEKAVLSVTLKDSDGNVVPSGTYADVFATGGIVASYALGTASDTTTATNALLTVDGVKKYTLYMPNTQATVKFTWTSGTGYSVAANQGVDGSVSVTVADQALEAANAATTAALAANDAVDALAATVAKLVANLKSQITALTKLIVKIQKKVGA